MTHQRLGVQSRRLAAAAVGLATVALTLASQANAAPGLDTVTGTGSGGIFTNIDIHAQADPSGLNVSGTAAFHVTQVNVDLSGAVTCLSVTGPDKGAGTANAPTTATMNFVDAVSGQVVTVVLTDNGGNGADTMGGGTFSRSPTDCSPLTVTPQGGTQILSAGRAIVVDSPAFPTSRFQCERDRWRNYPQFRSRRDCLRFVEKRR